MNFKLISNIRLIAKVFPHLPKALTFAANKSRDNKLSHPISPMNSSLFCRLTLVGRGWNERLLQPLQMDSMDNKQCLLNKTGFLADAMLDKVFRSSRVFVAPVFESDSISNVDRMSLGSGIATKIIRALSVGIPVVTTKAGVFSVLLGEG